MSASPAKQTIREGFHAVIEFLTSHFNGLSPFEIMNTEINDVYDLYVDVAIHNYKAKQKGNPNDGVWVTSKTATWH